MYVKLPDGYITIPPHSERRHNDSMSKDDCVSSRMEQGISGDSLGEDSSTAAASTPEGGALGVVAPTVHPVRAQRKRASRNNPLRHYKRRKKKTKIRKIKIKPVLPPNDSGN